MAKSGFNQPKLPQNALSFFWGGLSQSVLFFLSLVVPEGLPRQGARAREFSKIGYNNISSRNGSTSRNKKQASLVVAAVVMTVRKSRRIFRSGGTGIVSLQWVEFVTLTCCDSVRDDESDAPPRMRLDNA